tara:strand:- start:298 stop:705 length:408 start_codon:yes stop_codon:yes gene_type:complete
MDSIDDDIRAALETHLVGIAGLPDIAFENVKYDPTTGVSYIKTQMIPTRNKPAVRGTNPQLRYDGIFSVTVFIEEGNGVGEAYATVKLIKDAFAATTTVTLGSLNVSIDYAETQRGLNDSPWYFIPVNIGWYTYK